MDEFVRKTFPNVKRKRLTKQDENFTFGRKLLQQDTLSCYVEHENLRSHQIPGISSVEFLPCTKEYLCEVVFCRRGAQKLFRESVIVVKYFPFEPLRSNFDYLIREHICVSLWRLVPMVYLLDRLVFVYCRQEFQNVCIGLPVFTAVSQFCTKF